MPGDNKSIEKTKKTRICVVGLGYVGLPLALVLNKIFTVTGYDCSEQRIKELLNGYDKTNESDKKQLTTCSVEFTTDPGKIRECEIVIVTVPTPIDEHKKPDLSAMTDATRTVAANLRSGSIVIFESTVYPGVTEEVCIPILEKESGLKWKKDFNVGYSPERVNPGDKEHTIDKIQKVIAGDTEATAKRMEKVYGSIIKAGVFRASNIKTAEAAKVIENTQRDLNIALMNELSIIFNRMGIDTHEVLKAAATKWNFLPFQPGLVGGHCIGVDPYYLTFKAESIGYHPEVILSGRRINDNMGKYIAENTIKKLIKAGGSVKGSKILIMGFTFKENISDIRNTRVIDIFRELQEYNTNVFVYDPVAHRDEVLNSYGITLLSGMRERLPYDAIILAVKHRQFIQSLELSGFRDISNGKPLVLIDVKGIYNHHEAEKNGYIYWSL